MLALQLAWCGALALPLAKGPALALQGRKPYLCSFGSAMGSVDWTAAEWADWDPRWSEQQWAEFLGDSLDVPYEEEAPPPPPPVESGEPTAAAADRRKRGADSLGEGSGQPPASVPRTVPPDPCTKAGRCGAASFGTWHCASRAYDPCTRAGRCS